MQHEIYVADSFEAASLAGTLLLTACSYTAISKTLLLKGRSSYFYDHPGLSLFGYQASHLATDCRPFTNLRNSLKGHDILQLC